MAANQRGGIGFDDDDGLGDLTDYFLFSAGEHPYGLHTTSEDFFDGLDDPPLIQEQPPPQNATAAVPPPAPAAASAPAGRGSNKESKGKRTRKPAKPKAPKKGAAAAALLLQEEDNGMYSMEGWRSGDGFMDGSLDGSGGPGGAPQLQPPAAAPPVATNRKRAASGEGSSASNAKRTKTAAAAAAQQQQQLHQYPVASSPSLAETVSSTDTSMTSAGGGGSAKPARIRVRKKSGGGGGGGAAAVDASQTMRPPPPGPSPRVVVRTSSGGPPVMPSPRTMAYLNIGPPSFFPYASLPANLTPHELRNPAFMKALRNFASNPPHYLGANREWLMNDLKRAIDLIRGQKDFVDQQVALIDAFKAQATAALMMHDPSNKAGGGSKAKGKDSGGGGAAGDLADLGMPDDFPFLLDDDDKMFDGLLGYEDGDESMWNELGGDLMILDGQGGGGGSPYKGPPGQQRRGRTPIPLPTSHMDTDEGQEEEEEALSQQVDGGRASQQRRSRPPSRTSIPTTAPGGEIGYERIVRVKIRCDSLPRMKRKKEDMWARVVMPTPGDDVIIPIAEKKKYQKAQAAGGGALAVIDGNASTSSSGMTSPIDGIMSQPSISSLQQVIFPQILPTAKSKSKNKEEKRLHKKKTPPTGLSLLGPSGVSGINGKMPDLREMPFYDRLDAYADFVHNTNNLWLYVDEAGFLTSALQALGAQTTLAGAQRALDDLLPYETDDVMMERDSISRDVGEEFDEILDSVLVAARDKESKQAASGPSKDGSTNVLSQEEMESMEWAEVGYKKDLGRAPLLRRLLSAFVHPLTLRPPPVKVEEKEKQQQKQQQAEQKEKKQQQQQREKEKEEEQQQKEQQQQRKQEKQQQASCLSSSDAMEVVVVNDEGGKGQEEDGKGGPCCKKGGKNREEQQEGSRKVIKEEEEKKCKDWFDEPELENESVSLIKGLVADGYGSSDESDNECTRFLKLVDATAVDNGAGTDGPTKEVKSIAMDDADGSSESICGGSTKHVQFAAVGGGDKGDSASRSSTKQVGPTAMDVVVDDEEGVLGKVKLEVVEEGGGAEGTEDGEWQQQEEEGPSCPGQGEGVGDCQPTSSRVSPSATPPSDSKPSASSVIEAMTPPPRSPPPCTADAISLPPSHPQQQQQQQQELPPPNQYSSSLLPSTSSSAIPLHSPPPAIHHGQGPPTPLSMPISKRPCSNFNIGTGKSPVSSSMIPDRHLYLPSPKTPRGPHLEGLARSRLDEVLGEELEGLGLWESIDKDKARRQFFKTMAYEAQTTAHARLEAEIGIGIRQDERLAGSLRRINNLRIGRLRSKILEAVRAELDFRAKNLSEEEIMDRYNKMLKKKQAQEQRDEKKAAKVAAASAANTPTLGPLSAPSPSINEGTLLPLLLPPAAAASSSSAAAAGLPLVKEKEKGNGKAKSAPRSRVTVKVGRGTKGGFKAAAAAARASAAAAIITDSNCKIPLAPVPAPPPSSHHPQPQHSNNSNGLTEELMVPSLTGWSSMEAPNPYDTSNNYAAAGGGANDRGGGLSILDDDDDDDDPFMALDPLSTQQEIGDLAAEVEGLGLLGF